MSSLVYLIQKTKLLIFRMVKLLLKSSFNKHIRTKMELLDDTIFHYILKWKWRKTKLIKPLLHFVSNIKKPIFVKILLFPLSYQNPLWYQKHFIFIKYLGHLYHLKANPCMRPTPFLGTFINERLGYLESLPENRWSTGVEILP